MEGTLWAFLPAVIAIILALVTKQVYVSLFLGIVVGALMYAGGDPLNALFTLYQVMSEKVGGNTTIIVFLVVLGILVALGLRYLTHVISGYIFYGAWAEWWFSQESLGSFGQKILSIFSGKLLALIYSICYNGFYMIPDIIITILVSLPISQLRQVKKQ